MISVPVGSPASPTLPPVVSPAQAWGGMAAVAPVPERVAADPVGSPVSARAFPERPHPARALADQASELDPDATCLSLPGLVQRVVPLWLIFDTGEQILAEGPGLIGRNPTASDITTRIVAIDDPGRSISKVHLEYGLEGEQLWVKDRGSTNGSTLQRGGGPSVPLVPGEPTPLYPGDRVTFGDRRFEVKQR